MSKEEDVWLVLQIEWEWQYIKCACSTEQIAIRERDKLRSNIDKDDPHYQELIDCIQYQRLDVIME